VEHQIIGFQCFFEFILTECNRLVVIVRTNNFEIHSLAHGPPADWGLRRYARSISRAIFDGSASLLSFHKALGWRILHSPIRCKGFENGGGPERTRISDLFRVKEAL
jgi:hypothetical protein